MWSATLALVTTANTEETRQATEHKPDSSMDWRRVAIASVLLVVPCFWHEFLVCVDLGSHTYSAWMAVMAAAGKTPGIIVVLQKTNILFDWLLSAACTYFGYGAGEKIAVAITVLIFYWSAFAFLKSLAGRARWDLAAPLAIFSYGWTFQTGLFNFYLSVGLALAALAALWTRGARGRVVCVILVPLIVLAHPLGLCVFVGFAIFEWLSRRFGWRGIVGGLAAATVAAIAVRIFLERHYHVKYSDRPFWITTGPDQLVLYSKVDFAIALIVLLLFIATAIEACDPRWERTAEERRITMLAGSYYILVKLAVTLMPDSVLWSRTTAQASLLVNRATLVLGLLAIAVMATLRPHRWKTGTWAVLAVLFFGVLYVSTGRLNTLQRSSYETVRAFPPGTRFVANGDWQPLVGVNNPHLAERACVQRCFVISNYEIASNQFRVRASGPNPFVEVSLAQNDRMQDGVYVVREQDLPLYALHPCATGGSVCVGKLAAGDRNGHPSVELGTAVAARNP